MEIFMLEKKKKESYNCYNSIAFPLFRPEQCKKGVQSKKNTKHYIDEYQNKFISDSFHD